MIYTCSSFQNFKLIFASRNSFRTMKLFCNDLKPGPFKPSLFNTSTTRQPWHGSDRIWSRRYGNFLTNQLIRKLHRSKKSPTQLNSNHVFNTSLNVMKTKQLASKHTLRLIGNGEWCFDFANYTHITASQVKQLKERRDMFENQLTSIRNGRIRHSTTITNKVVCKTHQLYYNHATYCR